MAAISQWQHAIFAQSFIPEHRPLHGRLPHHAAGQVQIDTVSSTPTDTWYAITVTLFNGDQFVNAGHPAFAFDLSGALCVRVPTLTLCQCRRRKICDE
jgi:hypothetical protein